MKYYCYNEPIFDRDENLIGNEMCTFSEDDIRKNYFPYWEGKMIEKYGEEKYHELFSFQDCLDDWIVVHWAWESD